MYKISIDIPTNKPGGCVFQRHVNATAESMQAGEAGRERDLREGQGGGKETGGGEKSQRKRLKETEKPFQSLGLDTNGIKRVYGAVSCTKLAFVDFTISGEPLGKRPLCVRPEAAWIKFDFTMRSDPVLFTFSRGEWPLL